MWHFSYFGIRRTWTYITMPDGRYFIITALSLNKSWRQSVQVTGNRNWKWHFPIWWMTGTDTQGNSGWQMRQTLWGHHSEPLWWFDHEGISNVQPTTNIEKLHFFYFDQPPWRMWQMADNQNLIRKSTFPVENTVKFYGVRPSGSLCIVVTS